ncbi:hypothetical protein BHM03_00057945 [Ensete ventricosum]|nr:hypothetical protein BHM03_00057945 [Ensete ventricosum]
MTADNRCEATALDDVLESHRQVVRPSLLWLTGSLLLLLPGDFDPFSVVVSDSGGQDSTRRPAIDVSVILRRADVGRLRALPRLSAHYWVHTGRHRVNDTDGCVGCICANPNPA